MNAKVRRMPKTFRVMAEDTPLIEKLSRDHQAILKASGTYKEIATALHINVGTVRSRLNRARTALEALRGPEF